MVNNIILDDTYTIQTIQLDAMEDSSKKIQKEKQALVAHILMMIMQQSQKTEETGNTIASSSVDSVAAASDSSSQMVTFNWPKDPTQPNPPFDNTIPPKNPGETDSQYYLRVLKKLEQMIAWQKNNPMNINGESVLLTFMISFGQQFPGGLSHINTNLMETLMKNLIASVYVDSESQAAALQAMEAIKAMFAGSPSLKYILDDFDRNHGFDINTYINGYQIGSKDKEKDWQIFLLRAGGALAKVCVNDLPSLIKGIYDDELDIILKLAKACKNPFLYYLLLLSIIGQKETDTQGTIGGCGNMLKLLAKGESASGDAMSALSVLINQLEAKRGDASALNDFYKKIMDPDPAKRAALLEGLTPAQASELKNIWADGDSQAYKGLDLSSITDPGDQGRMVNSMNDLAQNATFKAKFPDYKDSDWTKINANMKDYLNNSPDAAKKLADTLLYLQEMSKDLEVLLPGIKDSTEKFFGKDGSGDFFSLTKITPDMLNKASEGDLASQKAISDAVYALVPKTQSMDSQSLTTINTEMSQIGTFFNDQNSQEQATAQFISSNDQKMLSFIKEMYDQPTTFTKAIMQNLSRT